jgi:hypothetical protein
MSVRNIPKMFQGQPIIGKDGIPEKWFVDAWNDLLDRTGGMSQDFVGNIINGTQSLADVNIAGVPLSGQLAAIDSNVTQAATEAAVGSGGLLLVLSVSSAVGTRDGIGTVTTNAVVVTASGGTAPYTYDVIKVSGDNIADTHSGASSNTVTFSETLGGGESLSAIYKWEVTDSTGTPLVASKSFPVSLIAYEFEFGGGGAPP